MQRLLSSAPHHVGIEVLLLRRMQECCGALFIDKMNVMLRDVEESLLFSRAVQSDAEDRERQPHKKSGEPLFSTTILTNFHWPIDHLRHAKLHCADFVLPDACDHYFQSVATTYRETHAARTLVLQPLYGFAIIRFACGDRSYRLRVSTLQMILLQAIDRLESVSVQVIT